MWCDIVLSLGPNLLLPIGAFWKHIYAEDTVIYSYGLSLHSA